MRRILARLALASLMLTLCGCGTSPTPTIRVGEALYQQEDTFISTVAQSLQQRALEEEQARGVKINLSVADGRGSQTQQNEQVDRFLDQKYDVICVNIVDRTAAAVIIDKAQAAGVPVIFFNRQPVEEDLSRWDGAYYVGSPGAQAGELQGQIVLEAWQQDPAALDRSGDGVVQYVMLEGEAGHQDALLRTKYSVLALTEAGVPVEKLANDTADWQRGQASIHMTQWLKEFGDQIEVVFANNDDMALGAIDACLAAELDPLPFVVGVDATPPALGAVEEGTLQGTVLNDAQGQAREMLIWPVTWRRARRRRWRTATMSGWSTLPSPERRWTPRLPERETKVNEWNRPRNALRSGAGFALLREKIRSAIPGRGAGRSELIEGHQQRHGDDAPQGGEHVDGPGILAVSAVDLGQLGDHGAGGGAGSQQTDEQNVRPAGDQRGDAAELEQAQHRQGISHQPQGDDLPDSRQAHHRPQVHPSQHHADDDHADGAQHGAHGLHGAGE